MTVNGFIKIHRKLLEWEWFSDSNTLHVFMFLLLRANWKEAAWNGIVLMPGQLATSVRSICEATTLSPRSVRTCMNRLKTTNTITIKTTNKYSLITIVNWASYQIDDSETTNEMTNEMTNERQTNDKQTTNERQQIKNSKNNKNNIGESKIPSKSVRAKAFVPPTVDEVRQYCLARNNGIDADRFVDHYQSVGWLVGKAKMKDWKAAVRTWERRNDNRQKSLLENNELKGWGL